jgi:3D (Asp-Asp-Asp) domain-containing protein
MRMTVTVPIIFLLLAAAAVAGGAARVAAVAPGGAWKPMGEYRITGYAACVKCCGKSDGITADGTYAPGFRGRLASAPREIPFGTKLWIAGVGLVEVHDRGGAIRGRRLELFFQKYDEALQWGVQKRQVWVWVAGD